MKTLLLIFMLVFPFKSNKGCLEMDIVILADLSGSVENYESFVEDAINTFIDKIDLSEENVRIGIIGFNDKPFIIAGLQGDKQQLKMLVSNFPFSGEGLTNMDFGLQIALNELYRDRYDVQKLIIVISDGAVNNEYKTKEIVSQLQSINIGICGVLIKDDTCNPQFMKDISGICYVETSYENLAMELAKMDVCL